MLSHACVGVPDQYEEVFVKYVLTPWQYDQMTQVRRIAYNCITDFMEANNASLSEESKRLAAMLILFEVVDRDGIVANAAIAQALKMVRDLYASSSGGDWVELGRELMLLGHVFEVLRSRSLKQQCCVTILAATNRFALVPATELFLNGDAVEEDVDSLIDDFGYDEYASMRTTLEQLQRSAEQISRAEFWTFRKS